MFAALPLTSRPFAASPRLPRAYQVRAVAGEYGYAAWSYSRQAKLNAWTWHGLGDLLNLYAIACLGNAIYMRDEADNFVYVQQPDVFYAEGEVSAESSSVEATTQWLDFGKPGKMKALTGLDFDGQNIETVEVYVSAGGDRDGVLSETLEVGSNQGGWTYSGEMLPLASTGTEFKLRFIASANLEAQVNRLTLHFDEIAG